MINQNLIPSKAFISSSYSSTTLRFAGLSSLAFQSEVGPSDEASARPAREEVIKPRLENEKGATLGEVSWEEE
jgi:hypothetical protein